VSAEKAARDYGVVLTEGLAIDAEATEAKRQELAQARGLVKDFDYGPTLDELLAHAEAETGLPAPKKPQPVKWAQARARRNGVYANGNGASNGAASNGAHGVATEPAASGQPA
jgi:N-methylhydantoinase B